MAALVAPLVAALLYGIVLVFNPIGSSEVFAFLGIIFLIAFMVEFFAALPYIFGVRGRVYVVSPAMTILGGVLMTQMLGIPVINLGNWGARHPALADGLTAMMVFTVGALAKGVVLGERSGVILRDGCKTRWSRSAAAKLQLSVESNWRRRFCS